MSEGTVHLALFTEIDPASEAIALLREMGISDKDMTIVSGVPFSDRMLGRPVGWSRVPQIAIAGFLAGLVAALLLNFGTPWSYPIVVGGMKPLSIAPSLVLIFEISMLGLMIFTFLGVIWESTFPSWGPHVYHPDISNGKIALVFNCPPEIHTRVHETLAGLGAEWVHRTEETVV
jgi:hypothetical protein